MAYDAPIMMSAPMVLACLRQVRGEPGGKTQHRVLPTKQLGAVERRFLCGEKLSLWVRETWAQPALMETQYRADPPIRHGHWNGEFGPWRPSIHMPRWASRLTLLDVTIRRERLGDISEADARAEGIIDGGCLNCGCSEPCGCFSPSPSAIDAYAYLWTSLHGPGSWDSDADKEVMVIGFRPVLGNIDTVEG